MRDKFRDVLCADRGNVSGILPVQPETSTQGDEADCLINEPGGENSPFTGTTTLADISNFCVKFGYLILGKIIKFVVTRCQILRLKCTKFDFGWGTPLGELEALLQDPQLG